MELIFIFITAAVVNNLVLTYFLGICPFLGVSRRIDTAVGMGFAVTFVVVMAASATWLVDNFLLQPMQVFGHTLDLGFAKYVVFILVIAALVQLVEMYLRKFFPPLYRSLGIYLPLITTNCAILGTCLFLDLWRPDYLAGTVWAYAFLKAVIYSLGGGLGFTMAISIMAGIREQLQFSDVPAPLKGAGIALIVAGLLALAFMGFAGMGGGG